MPQHISFLGYKQRKLTAGLLDPPRPGRVKSEEIVAMFYEEELLKTNWKEFKVEKVIKRKGNALYVKWKAFDSSFTSWIDK